MIHYVVKKTLNSDNTKFMYFRNTIDIMMLSLRYIVMMIVAVLLSSTLWDILLLLTIIASIDINYCQRKYQLISKSG